MRFNNVSVAAVSMEHSVVRERAPYRPVIAVLLSAGATKAWLEVFLSALKSEFEENARIFDVSAGPMIRAELDSLSELPEVVGVIQEIVEATNAAYRKRHAAAIKAQAELDAALRDLNLPLIQPSA